MHSIDVNHKYWQYKCLQVTSKLYMFLIYRGEGTIENALFFFKVTADIIEVAVFRAVDADVDFLCVELHHHLHIRLQTTTAHTLRDCHRKES